MTDQPTPPPDTCPRCGGRFHCGARASDPCACASLVLSADLLARLRDQYKRCLCLNCLRELTRSAG